MSISMETTIDNLKKLDESNYEHISVIISELVKQHDRVASEDEVMESYKRISSEYSETFKALAQ